MDGVTFSTSPNTQSGDTNWLLAWSVMAGAGFQLSERVILDLGYRFIDMGKAESDTADTSGSTNNAPWGWTTLPPPNSRSACAFISAAEPRAWPCALFSPGTDGPARRVPGRTPLLRSQFALI